MDPQHAYIKKKRVCVFADVMADTLKRAVLIGGPRVHTCRWRHGYLEPLRTCTLHCGHRWSDCVPGLALFRLPFASTTLSSRTMRSFPLLSLETVAEVEGGGGRLAV